MWQCALPNGISAHGGPRGDAPAPCARSVSAHPAPWLLCWGAGNGWNHSGLLHKAQYLEDRKVQRGLSTWTLWRSSPTPFHISSFCALAQYSLIMAQPRQNYQKPKVPISLSLCRQMFSSANTPPAALALEAAPQIRHYHRWDK